ncbi:hypothetical protein HPB51_012777 [Rhipicephalus microplus]|uniref:Uncharacterized protein n=1 Tax=Rhipicephalus microplus TaxID=6941 RepID=A0A9J6EA18_RHIMP|nr:hypothetical protein HPB51_012777 [Rhipicephalus microplus]
MLKKKKRRACAFVIHFRDIVWAGLFYRHEAAFTEFQQESACAISEIASTKCEAAKKACTAEEYIRCPVKPGQEAGTSEERSPQVQSVMGKKCFVPRCSSGYRSCSDKVSLFAALKDSDRLKVWRHAIPRKDHELQTTDLFVKNILMRDWSPNHGKRYIKETFLSVRRGRRLWQKTPSQRYFLDAKKKAPVTLVCLPAKKRCFSGGDSSSSTPRHRWIVEALIPPSLELPRQSQFPLPPLPTAPCVKLICENPRILSLESG